MWFIRTVNSILRTLYPTIQVGDTLLKTASNNILKIRNSTDTGYNSVDALSYLVGGLPLFNIAILGDVKATTVAGGTSVATTWNNRDINTELSDPNGLVTINSNKYIPIAGTYLMIASSPVFGAVGGTRCRNRFFNVTTNTVPTNGYGQSTFVASGTGIFVSVSTVITANGTDEYRVDTYTSTGIAGGLGSSANDGTDELYTTVTLMKL